MPPHPLPGDEPDAFCRALVQVLSHDAQGPLTSVIGFAHTLQRADVEPAARDAALRAVVRNARRLSLLLRNLVDAARLEAGEVELYQERVDVGELLEHALARFDDLALDRPVVRDAWEPGVTRADPDRLLTVVLNVLHNAALHPPPGGTVHLAVLDRVVEVADEGPGFSAPALAHATDPFWRGPEATGAGAGVGLFVARRLLEAMGGALELGTAPTGGARVRLVLPAAAGA